jgi:long-chain-fatty-acid--CoA ligase ACSBG
MIIPRRKIFFLRFLSSNFFTFLSEFFSMAALYMNHRIKSEQKLIFILSHIAGQMLDVYSATFLGSTVYFANPDVFKGTLTKTLIHAKPTIFLAVPRVWEKLQEKITENVAGLSKMKAQLFNWASKSKFDHIQAKLANKGYKTLQSYIADKLVLNKIRCLLGLHETRLLLSGAAPLSKKTLDFFIGLGMQITDMFGMSETGGPHTICVPEKNRIGSVGFLHQFNATKIINPDKFGEGEVCLFGRNLFMGYLNSAIKTHESMDIDGYLHSGDLGKIDSDGFVYITGRIKEIIITAGGENVAPVPIEEAIKEELADILSNCMVIGDKRKYLTILITLKVSLFSFGSNGFLFETESSICCYTVQNGYGNFGVH